MLGLPAMWLKKLPPRRYAEETGSVVLPVWPLCLHTTVAVCMPPHHCPPHSCSLGHMHTARSTEGQTVALKLVLECLPRWTFNVQVVITKGTNTLFLHLLIENSSTALCLHVFWLWNLRKSESLLTDFFAVSWLSPLYKWSGQQPCSYWLQARFELVFMVLLISALQQSAGLGLAGSAGSRCAIGDGRLCPHYSYGLFSWVFQYSTGNQDMWSPGCAGGSTFRAVLDPVAAVWSQAWTKTPKDPQSMIHCIVGHLTQWYVAYCHEHSPTTQTTSNLINHECYNAVILTLGVNELCTASESHIIWRLERLASLKICYVCSRVYLKMICQC